METNIPKSAEEKFLETMQSNLKRAIKADSHNRKDAIDSLKFVNGEQWSQSELRRRELANRPALTVNMLTKYVNQLVGDERLNRPRVKVHPVDTHADTTMASIREGLISSIEYNSDAAQIYDDAFEMCVKCGYGAWRILTREAEDDPFVQEIYIEGIPNPFKVLFDPDSISPTFSDAKYAFIIDKMPKDEFKEKYPKVEIPGQTLDIGLGGMSENWFDGELVTVVEYFLKDTKTTPMVQLEDGTVLTKKEFDKRLKSWTERYNALLTKSQLPAKGLPPRQSALNALPSPPPAGQPPMLQPGQVPPAPGQPSPQPAPAPPAPGQPSPQSAPAPPAPVPNQDIQVMISQLGDKPKYVKKKDTQETIIKHWVCTYDTILNDNGVEGEVFAGKYIPIVLVVGEKVNIEGKVHIRGIVHAAKDAQKSLNYWITAAAEVTSSSPKAPWLGTPKQFEGHENEYAAANIENYPFLRYNVDPDVPGPPQRMGPPQPPAALFTQISVAEEHIKSVVGMFNADVGANGSEQTGAAITARQRPGDVGTFRYMDNLARCIGFSGKIINEMIPAIYDTERDIRLRFFDESDSYVPINTTIGESIEKIKKFPERFSRMDKFRILSAAKKYGMDATFNDMTAGKYDTRVVVGPSYSTQRQDSVSSLLSLVNSMPQQMSLGADILVKNMDFNGAEELAKRLKKTLPPGLVEPTENEPNPTPLPPNPAQLLQQLKLQQEQTKVQLMTLKGETEKLKIALKQKELQHQDVSSAMEYDLNKRKLDNETIASHHANQADIRSHHLDKMKVHKGMVDEQQNIRDTVMQVLSELAAQNNHPTGGQ